MPLALFGNVENFFESGEKAERNKKITQLFKQRVINKRSYLIFSPFPSGEVTPFPALPSRLVIYRLFALFRCFRNLGRTAPEKLNYISMVVILLSISRHLEKCGVGHRKSHTNNPVGWVEQSDTHH